MQHQEAVFIVKENALEDRSSTFDVIATDGDNIIEIWNAPAEFEANAFKEMLDILVKNVKDCNNTSDFRHVYDRFREFNA